MLCKIISCALLDVHKEKVQLYKTQSTTLQNTRHCNSRYKDILKKIDTQTCNKKDNWIHEHPKEVNTKI